MRTFISVNLPENAKKEIAKIQNSLPDFTGKKTEPENLHLTLKFLGEIDEEKLEKVKNKLSKIKLERFDAQIDELGIFFRYERAIIWLHLKNCEKLQKEIDNTLEGLFEKEKRFMSHLTIARAKKIKNKKSFLEKISKIKIKPMEFNTDKFFLMKSRLSPRGPVYTVLEEFPLI